MNIGAVITQGPQTWQIIQQQQGLADIRLKGIYRLPEGAVQGSVYARVVSEDTCETLIKWQEAEHLEADEWQIVLEDIPAGGLYRVETCLRTSPNQHIEWATRGDMIHHLGVGDVYVIAGQSNSAGYGKGPVFDPPEIGIHLLKNSGKWDLASHPFNESTHTIHDANTDGANTGHSPYLSFARRLKKDLGYPIGLIQTAKGGSPLSDWNPEEEGILYHNMIQIIKESSQRIKGILWYQGCSDTNELEQAESYLTRFETMVEALRKDLNQSDLPILTVQLNRVLGGIDSDEIAITHQGWLIVREAQRVAADKIKYVYVIPSIDSSLSDAIHNASHANLVIGERMARMALGAIYGKKVIYNAPNIKEALKLDDETIKMVFDYVNERLDAFDVAPKDLTFQVEDESGSLQIIGYAIETDTIILSLNRKLTSSAYVSCGFGRAPSGNIPMDRDGQLPMLLFYKMPIA